MDSRRSAAPSEDPGADGGGRASGRAVSRRDALRSLAAGWLAAGLQVPGELLIRGGEVFVDGRTLRADVRIRGEEIVEVGPGLRPEPGVRVVDARGRLVLPGGVDPHTHLSPPFADDFTSGSRAALAGGITTLGTFAFPQPDEDLSDTLARYQARVREEAVADVMLHGYLWPPDPAAAARVESLAAAGHPSLKVFMLADGFEASLPGVVRLMEAARDAGVVCMVHCEDSALLRAASDRLRAEGRTSLRHYAESRPVAAEISATRLAASLCERTGAATYVVHLSSAEALEVCRRERAAGRPLRVETRPMYLHLTDDRYQGPDGPLFVGQPPLRKRTDVEALWQGLARGEIDVLATDHAPWTREQKLDPHLDIERLRPGTNNLQVMLPMYFSEGVVRGRIDLARFVETTATGPARIFGLHPRKGVIRPGALADVVVWNPRLTRVVRGADALSRAGFSIYEGWEVTGWPEVTVRRGEVVFEGGRVLGRPGTGEVLARQGWS